MDHHDWGLDGLPDDGHAADPPGFEPDDLTHPDATHGDPEHGDPEHGDPEHGDPVHGDPGADGDPHATPLSLTQDGPDHHAPDPHDSTEYHDAPDQHDRPDQHELGAVDEPVPAGRIGGLEALVGADPDVHPGEDIGWDHPPFPPEVTVDRPDPVDGYPWTDPTVLGTAEAPGRATAADLDAGSEPVAAADLAAYDGTEPPDGPDPWAALLGSEDPATSALARWWSPG